MDSDDSNPALRIPHRPAAVGGEGRRLSRIVDRRAKVAARWLDAYFAGQAPSIGALPLRPEGSAFRQEVWKLLCDIPYGHVTTYGLLAQKLAARRGVPHLSAQAVGGAVGHNPLSILIPCHRVVGADGSLTGYAGGIERKKALLTLEGVDVAQLRLSVRAEAR